MVTEAPVTQSDGNTAFLRAARAGNLDKVLEHLKSDVDINTANANGLNALHLASKEGHTHVVTELLSRGATVDASTKKGNTALHIASLAGQEEVVRLLVQHGAAVNVQSQNGFTPLYMAAQENHDNVVKFLLANGANQSLATEDGFTPLAVAMQQGHDKVVAVLLENDTRGKVRLPALHIAAKKDDCKAAALLLQNEHNPDVTSKSGFTPLHIAAHYGNEAIANLLLNKGADVNYSAKHNISPLHVAAKWGKSNLVALLLERGAHIEAKTRDGLTPLHCAARSGHEQVVDMMLDRGAPISCKTKNGLAPLHMAAQGDHVDAARILLYHRAPVDEITVDYLTALHVAAHCGHVRVAKLLLDRKADPNARALNGFTPLHIACKKNRIKVVELLLKHGASIEATTESGLTPLHVASFMGCMNIVIYLLQNEANPDVPTVRGETPLHLAARANQTDIIRILLRNGAQVDARAREQQTPLHIASRLGNVDIVMLLLQHGAAVDSTTKDLYTALHIAAKEGQEEVAAVLLDNGASLTATTNKGCTPLHLAAKYGNMKVARLLLQKDAPVDSQGKNGVTPLHVASHYDHQNVALLLLDKGASPHATAKNGHTPLHIAARKNQMDIATTLLEYGAKANAESRAGFTPLHLSSQEGHTDMSTLLIEHQADTNHQAKNGLTPLHLCAQEDRVNVAQILVKNGADVDSTTKAGYTPLHVASHFGQVNMVRFLLQHGAATGAVTSVGYTPLHQAAQQGHSGVVSILLNSGAQPNVTTKQGQTALSIAQKLGYISVVETLKVVTEVTTITTTTTTTIEEKYRVVAPETMQETFMSDSEEEGGDQGLECTGMYFGKPTHAQHVYLPYYEGQSLLKREDTLLNEQPYHYLTVDEMKSLGDDSLPIDVTQDDRHDSNRDLVSPQHAKEVYAAQMNYTSDNVDISRHPVNVGFLVSFLVDARGGAMRGCRHSGVRVIVPPRKAPQPLRVTCRYLKRDKLSHPPPLMEGEALASRILELGPVGAKFLGPVIIEVPHFGSLRGREREIVILRSDNGETWREHTVEASEDAIHDVLNESFEKDGERNELSQLEVCDSGRLTRILTTDFPQYFAVVSRVRQEVHAIGPEGGMVSSSVVPQVQAVFPQGALTKKIKVGLQAQPIAADLVAKLLGNRVAVSPIVTVEPRRRKFHKPITLTIPVPQAANKGMINQYSGDAPTLRLLCSITGGTTRAQWEDVTGSTPLTFVNDCVSFTTTVSARFWLMDCRNISEATRMATELYKEAIHVPFLAKFVVFSKRVDFLEARLRVFCMTDDKEDKTLEHQEHFTEVAKSRDVEVLEGKAQFVEFAGNLVPVTKSGEQQQLGFRGFRENRLAFTTRVKDPHADPVGRILFMKEAKVQKGDPPQQPVCVLNIVLPDDIIPESSTAESTPVKYSHSHSHIINGTAAPARPELRLSDISNTLGSDWESLAIELGLSRSDVERIKSDHPASAAPQHAMAMLRLWLQRLGNKASGTELQQALQRLGRDDIIHRCMISCDDQEMNLTSSHLGLDQSGFDNLRDELGVSRDGSRDVSRETSLRRNLSLEAGGPYDEQDIMKDSESVEELVEKQIERIGEIKEIKKKASKDQDDSEERKYVAEEKEVEEKRKSVRERTQDIEKRLSQTSMDEQQQRRDSQLLQGVSEGLERLNITHTSEGEGDPNWHETKVSTTTTTTRISTEQHPGSQGADDAPKTQPSELKGITSNSAATGDLEHEETSVDGHTRPKLTGGNQPGVEVQGPHRTSVIEETFVKTTISGSPVKEESSKLENEFDKKKDKKEKDREEKERKKREKRERELREKGEKERKEKEKKERKEREKREKEDRLRREKEEKRNKAQKEKAEKEKMEKEKRDAAAASSYLERPQPVEEVVVKSTGHVTKVSSPICVVSLPGELPGPSHLHNDGDVTGVSSSEKGPVIASSASVIAADEQPNDLTVSVNEVPTDAYILGPDEVEEQTGIQKGTTTPEAQNMVPSNDIILIGKVPSEAPFTSEEQCEHIELVRSEPESPCRTDTSTIKPNDFGCESAENKIIFASKVPSEAQCTFGRVTEKIDKVQCGDIWEKDLSYINATGCPLDVELRNDVPSETKFIASDQNQTMDLDSPSTKVLFGKPPCSSPPEILDILQPEKNALAKEISIEAPSASFAQVQENNANEKEHDAISSPFISQEEFTGSPKDSVKFEISSAYFEGSNEASCADNLAILKDQFEGPRSIPLFKSSAKTYEGPIEQTTCSNASLSDRFLANFPDERMSVQGETGISFSASETGMLPSMTEKNGLKAESVFAPISEVAPAIPARDTADAVTGATTSPFLKSIVASPVQVVHLEAIEKQLVVETGSGPLQVRSLSEISKEAHDSFSTKDNIQNSSAKSVQSLPKQERFNLSTATSSQSTTTFKTKKVPGKPGELPHVINTVTEKTYSLCGMPETVKTTITDKKITDGGRADEIFTTGTAKSYSDNGAPAIVKTTVTEKLSSFDGKPVEATTFVVTENLDQSDSPAASINDAGTHLLPLLDEEFLRNTPKVAIVTHTLTEETRPARERLQDNTGTNSVVKELCYVTTPTMQRRAHSQRRPREDRPAPIDVSYIQGDESDEEDYIVTEPTEEGSRVDNHFRVNSSPEILSMPHSSREQRRSPDQNRVKFQLGSLDSQDSFSSDLNSPLTPGTKTHKFTVEKVEEETLVTVPQGGIDQNLSEIKYQEDKSGDQNSKLKRVERHFERMASQSLAEGTTPVKEVDYQRVLSQLSHDEVAVSDNEYENLLNQMTPSEDSPGGTDESPEAMEATILLTAEVPERTPVPSFIYTQPSEDRDIDFDWDEQPTPPPVPTSMFWCFDDRPMRASSLSLDELGLPLSEPTAAGEALTHWDNTDHLDLSLEEPVLPSALPRPSNRSASVVEELLHGNETIPAPLARSVLRSTFSQFSDIPEVPSDEQRPDDGTPRPRSPHVSPRKSVPLNRSPLGQLFEGGLAEAPEEEDVDSVEEARQ